MAIHWQLIGDELATSWHLVGTALAHGTKADWANEGGHWRANEEAFIGNSLAQSSDVIWEGIALSLVEGHFAGFAIYSVCHLVRL